MKVDVNYKQQSDRAATLQRTAAPAATSNMRTALARHATTPRYQASSVISMLLVLIDSDGQLEFFIHV